MNKVKAMAALAMSIATFGTSSVMAHALPMYYPEETQLETRGNSYNWGRHAIRWAYADGVTVGKTGGKFEPDQSITRAEAVTMLTKIKEIDASKYSGDSKVFNDVNGEWFTSYVNAAYENGFVVGKGKGVFAPNDTLTRAEAATMIVNACGYKAANESKISFTDISDAWYTNYIKAAYDNKIVSGKSEKTFDPNGNVTRAEFVMMLYNSVMGVNEKGSYCAVMFGTDNDSFKIVSNETELLSFNENEKHEVKGATKVTSGDDWNMAYFTPTDSFEVEFTNGEYGFFRFYAYGQEYTIKVRYIKKIVFNNDGSVVCYSDDVSKLFHDMQILTSNNMKLEVANGETCIVGQKFENGFEQFARDEIADTYDVTHENSEFIKFTPMKENSTIELGVEFSNTGDMIAGLYDEDVYLYGLDDTTKLQIKDKVYDIDLKVDPQLCEIKMYGCDYDRDGQQDHLLEIWDENGEGLYSINVKDDQNAELVRIDDEEVDTPFILGANVYPLKGKKDEVIFCHYSLRAFPVSLEGSDLLVVDPKTKEVYNRLGWDGTYGGMYCADYDGDGQEEFAIDKREAIPGDSGTWEGDFNSTLYMIDQFDGVYKVVKCPKLNLDDLPNTKAAIEAHQGFAGFVDHTREFFLADGKATIAACIDFYVDYTEGDQTKQEMVHYEDTVEYHADGTFSFDDSGKCNTSVG